MRYINNVVIQLLAKIKNMRYLILLLSISILSCSPIKNHYLQFGSYSSLQNSENSKTKLFFDRYGKIYPKVEIDNDKLKASYSSLKLYYQNNLELLQTDLEKLNIKIEDPITKKK